MTEEKPTIYIRPGGRPSIYTEELANKICEVVATHDIGLKKLCEMYDWMPDLKTILLWRRNKEQFFLLYSKAKQEQGELYAESTIEIANEKPTYRDAEGNERVDAGHVAWQKLNVNTRQWHASKLAPKIYGDQKQIEELKNNADLLKAEVMTLRAQLDEKNKREY